MMRFITLLLLILSVSTSVASDVNFTDDNNGFFNHASISPWGTPLDEMANPSVVFDSPANGGKILVVNPDTLKGGPWSCDLYVYPIVGNPFRIECNDVSNGLVDVKWINDKYVFVKVLIGRIVSLDLIVNTEDGKYIAKDVAWYRE